MNRLDRDRQIQTKLLQARAEERGRDDGGYLRVHRPPLLHRQAAEGLVHGHRRRCAESQDEPAAVSSIQSLEGGRGEDPDHGETQIRAGVEGDDLTFDSFLLESCGLLLFIFLFFNGSVNSLKNKFLKRSIEGKALSTPPLTQLK